MVLLTAVPVSLPGSMVTGVMVATGAIAAGARAALPRWAAGVAAADRPAAVRRGGIGGGHVTAVAAEHVVDVGTGGQAQARRQHASQKKALFEPRLAGNPLILLSAAGAPAPK